MMSDELIELCFQPGGHRVWVRAGVTLVEAAAGAGVEIVTGCTRGMCGTDPVRVTAGADLLEGAGDDERGTLERMGVAPPEYRLACSARTARAGAVVEVDVDAM